MQFKLCILFYLNLHQQQLFLGVWQRATTDQREKRNDLERDKKCIHSQSCSPVNLPQSVAQELLAAVVPILLFQAFPWREEVGTEQSVEINQNHDVHHHQGHQEVAAMVQPGVVLEDVPGEVELCAEAEQDVRQEVGEFVDVVEGGGLSARQLQHQPQV